MFLCHLFANGKRSWWSRSAAFEAGRKDSARYRGPAKQRTIYLKDSTPPSNRGPIMLWKVCIRRRSAQSVRFSIATGCSKSLSRRRR